MINPHPNSPQFLHIIASGSAFERGRTIAQQSWQKILDIYALKGDYYAENMAEWQEWADYAKKNIQKYTPIVYEELLGMASVSPLSEEIIFQLAVEYDFSMKITIDETRSSQKCSGFAVMPTDPTLHSICGQTNDEGHEYWGDSDVIITYMTDGGNAVVYTHAGYSAYFGVNSHGVCIIWQTMWYDIPFNFKNSVPSVPMMREMLTKKTIHEAVALFQSCPTPSHNNFILIQQNVGIYNIESSPTIRSIQFQPSGIVIHTNHTIYCKDLIIKDLNNGASSTSKSRFFALQSNLNLTISAKDCEDFLLKFPLLNHNTLCTLVIDANEQTLTIIYPFYRVFSCNKKQI